MYVYPIKSPLMCTYAYANIIVYACNCMYIYITKGSMYGILTCIYHKNHPNVGKYM